MKPMNRMSGILLHPTSLPSAWGIGDLGAEAFAFVDFLEAAGQHLWQVLPLTHTGLGDSPYQSFSAFAGQPLLISPSHLLDLGLVTEQDLEGCPRSDPSHIDYGQVIPWKHKLLRQAHRHFPALLEKDASIREDYHRFCAGQKNWLDDYALFMACKDANGGKCWQEWEEPYRLPDDGQKKELAGQLEEAASYYRFIQFLFFEEWLTLKKYANEHQVQIIGDIPIFVSMDSADVWANRRLFQLDAKGYPLAVSGVPPDYFSATGQLWGNPLYRWETHRAEHFSWWIQRMQHQLRAVDILRIDHFRGFESCWSVPYGEKTAINGAWTKTPGEELFSAITESLGRSLPIIAEDLGVITEEVTALRNKFHFPGMKILQFAFDSTEENDYLPHRYESPECVCYTGTHDNDTSNGWFCTLNPDAKAKVKAYANTCSDTDISRGFIRLCLGSIAAYAIIPLQDVLGLGSDARMNFPGVAFGNWNWRYTRDALTEEVTEELKRVTKLFGR